MRGSKKQASRLSPPEPRSLSCTPRHQGLRACFQAAKWASWTARCRLDTRVRGPAGLRRTCSMICSRSSRHSAPARQAVLVDNTQMHFWLGVCPCQANKPRRQPEWQVWQAATQDDMHTTTQLVATNTPLHHPSHTARASRARHLCGGLGCRCQSAASIDPWTLTRAVAPHLMQ